MVTANPVSRRLVIDPATTRHASLVAEIKIKAQE